MDYYPTTDELPILETVRPFTMTSGQRIAQTIRAIRELDKQNIEGDFVECGVWKGGQVIAAYLANTQTKRMFWLYDTFEGMTIPTKDDYKVDEKGNVSYAMKSSKAKNGFNNWCRAEVDEVIDNVRQHIPMDQCRFVKGDVCQTLKLGGNLPNKIALLRLDTDWYESTKIELEKLWPRVVPGGIMVLDDYHSWGGSRKAFHEVFGDSLEIHTIDTTAIWVKKDK